MPFIKFDYIPVPCLKTTQTHHLENCANFRRQKCSFSINHIWVLLTFKKLPMDPTHRHSRCLPDTKKSKDLRRCGFQKTDPFLLMVTTSPLGSDLHQVIYKGCNLFLSFSNDRVSGNIWFKNLPVKRGSLICHEIHLLQLPSPTVRRWSC